MFTHQKAVRWVAAIDCVIALLMMMVLWHVMLTLTVDSLLLLLTSIIFAISALQFIMAQVLMTATYSQMNFEIPISRCQKWLRTSLFLYFMLGIEFLFLVWCQGPYWITLLKTVFRAIGSHVVNLYLADLRWHSGLSASIENVPNTNGDSTHSDLSNLQVLDPHLPKYEEPPSYEESMKNSQNQGQDMAVRSPNLDINGGNNENLSVSRPLPQSAQCSVLTD